MATHLLPLRVWPLALAGWLTVVAFVAASPYEQPIAVAAALVAVVSAVRPENRGVGLARLAGTTGLGLFHLLTVGRETLLLNASWAVVAVAEIVIQLLGATIAELRRARRGLGRSPTTLR